jgi:hypothetical protein
VAVIAFGDVQGEAAAGTAKVMIVADVSRMASLIIMGQLRIVGCCDTFYGFSELIARMALLVLGRVCCNGMCGTATEVARSPDAACNHNPWQECTRGERLALLKLINFGSTSTIAPESTKAPTFNPQG